MPLMWEKVTFKEHFLMIYWEGVLDYKRVPLKE